LKLLRLALLQFQPAPAQSTGWTVSDSSGVKLRTIGAWQSQGAFSIIVVGELELSKLPQLDSAAQVIVPELERKQIEATIERLANVVAVTERCRRSITSPSPYVALLPGGDEDKAFLAQATGFSESPVAHAFVPRVRLPVNSELLAGLDDRSDGLALLAEALSHGHATGRFHELMRVFERAFARSSSKLWPPLAEFLCATPFGYTAEEVKEWIQIRHPATHADVRPTFLLASDVQPFVARMEQAAYDVLFNKVEWRRPSADRRALLVFDAGTSKADGSDLFIRQGITQEIAAAFMDGFRAYPLDLKAVLKDVPEDWWCGSKKSTATDQPEPSDEIDASISSSNPS
jgi:hypothetical protein